MHKTRQSDTWTGSQTSQGQTGRKAVYIHSQTKTNRSDSLSADSGGRNGVWWHVAADGSLPPLPPLFLLFLCHLWRRKHFLRECPPSSKPRVQVIYHERPRSPQIKVYLFPSRAHTCILHTTPSDGVSVKVTVTPMGVCLCEQTFCKIYFKHFPLITQNLLFTDVNICIMPSCSSVRQSVLGTKRFLQRPRRWWHGPNENYFYRELD